MQLQNIKVCKKCIYDENVSSITFDSDGVCKYCHQVESLKAQYGTGLAAGEARLSSLIDQIKKEGQGKKVFLIISS